MSETKALMVIDVQCVYMEPEPMVTSDGDNLIDKCNGLIEKARAAGVPVVYVQHMGDDRPDDPELIGVHPELAPRAGEPVIQKRFGSAFFKTDLGETLRDLGAETLYVCGLATFGCVNATVMCRLHRVRDDRREGRPRGAGLPGFDGGTGDRPLQFRAGTRRRAAHLSERGELLSLGDGFEALICAPSS
jgi:hypothetical protein